MNSSVAGLLTALCCTVALQLLLGCTLVGMYAARRTALRSGPRRPRARWARSARLLRPLLLPSGALAGIGLLARPVPDGLTWLAVAGAPAAAGCALLIAGGRLERRGRWRRARLVTRSGGLLVALGSAAALLTLTVLSLPARALPPTLVAGAAWAVATSVGLLTGLSGKPRPGDAFAGAFYLTGWVSLLLA